MCFISKLTELLKQANHQHLAAQLKSQESLWRL